MKPSAIIPKITLIGIFMLLITMPLKSGLWCEEATPNYYPQEEWNASMLGAGGARRTFADDASAILSNPAGLAFNSNAVSFDLSGGLFDRQDANQMMFSVIDGQTSTVIGGAQFLRYSAKNYEKYSYAVSAAYPYRNLFFGATTRLIDYNGVPSTDKVWSNNFGVLGSMNKAWFLSVVLQNVSTSNKQSVDPMTIAFGAGAILSDIVRISVESDRPLESAKGTTEDFNLSFGAELNLQKYLLLRGGYRWDRMGKLSFWSAGGGITAEKALIGASYSREIDQNYATYNFILRVAY